MDDRNSFWNVIKRFFTGRPAFVSYDADLDSVMNYRPEKPTKEDLIHDADGNLVQPELKLERHIEHIKNDELVLCLNLRNSSQLCLEVRYIEIFGSTKEVDRIIGPNETEQVEAFAGDIPPTTRSCYMNIIYRELYSGVGHVFRSSYFIKFIQYHDDRHYLAYNFHKL